MSNFEYVDDTRIHDDSILGIQENLSVASAHKLQRLQNSSLRNLISSLSALSLSRYCQDWHFPQCLGTYSTYAQN